MSVSGQRERRPVGGSRLKREQVMSGLPDIGPGVKGKALLQITPGERQALQLIAQGKAVGEVGAPHQMTVALGRLDSAVTQ